MVQGMEKLRAEGIKDNELALAAASHMDLKVVRCRSSGGFPNGGLSTFLRNGMRWYSFRIYAALNRGVLLIQQQ